MDNISYYIPRYIAKSIRECGYSKDSIRELSRFLYSKIYIPSDKTVLFPVESVDFSTDGIYTTQFWKYMNASIEGNLEFKLAVLNHLITWVKRSSVRNVGRAVLLDYVHDAVACIKIRNIGNLEYKNYIEGIIYLLGFIYSEDICPLPFNLLDNIKIAFYRMQLESNFDSINLNTWLEETIENQGLPRTARNILTHTLTYAKFCVDKHERTLKSIDIQKVKLLNEYNLLYEERRKIYENLQEENLEKAYDISNKSIAVRMNLQDDKLTALIDESTFKYMKDLNYKCWTLLTRNNEELNLKSGRGISKSLQIGLLSNYTRDKIEIIKDFILLFVKKPYDSAYEFTRDILSEKPLHEAEKLISGLESKTIKLGGESTEIFVRNTGSIYDN